MIEFVAIPEERIKILKRNEVWRKKLKKLSDAKIFLNEDVQIEGGDPIHVTRVKEVFKAFGRGFDFETALNLLDEEYFLEMIEVKDFAGKSKVRQTVLKARVIGTGGKMKKQIEKFTETKIAIYGKTISIIGKWSNVQNAKEAIGMLLSGRSHSTVYRFLER